MPKAAKADKPAKQTKPKEPKEKKKKDPNAPKKPLSSFMLFSQAQRSVIKQENPDASFGEMGKLIGNKWKEIDEKEKAKYQELADKDKIRYQKEMETYVPPKDSDKKGAKEEKVDDENDE